MGGGGGEPNVFSMYTINEDTATLTTRTILCRKLSSTSSQDHEWVLTKEEMEEDCTFT